MHLYAVHVDLTCEEMFALLGEALFQYYKWRGGEIRTTGANTSFEFAIHFEMANRDDQHIAQSYGGVNSEHDALLRLLHVLNSDSNGVTPAQFMRTHRTAVCLRRSSITGQQAVRVVPELLDFSNAAPPPPSPQRGPFRVPQMAVRTLDPQPRSSFAEPVNADLAAQMIHEQQDVGLVSASKATERPSAAAAGRWIYTPPAKAAQGTCVRANPTPVSSVAVPSVIVVEDNGGELLDDPTEGFGPSVSQIGAPAWRPATAAAPRRVTLSSGAGGTAPAISTQPHMWTTFLTRGAGATATHPTIHKQAQRVNTTMYSTGWADEVPATADPAAEAATSFAVNRFQRGPNIVRPTDAAAGTSGWTRQAGRNEVELADQMSGWRTPGRSEREATRVGSWLSRDIELPDEYDLRFNRAAISCCNFAPVRRF